MSDRMTGRRSTCPGCFSHLMNKSVLCNAEASKCCGNPDPCHILRDGRRNMSQEFMNQNAASDQGAQKRGVERHSSDGSFILQADARHCLIYNSTHESGSYTIRVAPIRYTQSSTGTESTVMWNEFISCNNIVFVILFFFLKADWPEPISILMFYINALF